MKIFHLSRGRGQFGIRGGVIHFPQRVEEVCELLPLRAEEADIIVVNQTLENVDSLKSLNSYDSINAMYKRLNGFNSAEVDPRQLSYDEKKSLLDSSPITAARHFNYRVKQLFKLMKRHSEQLFGYKLQDYTYRIEFQNRGSG